MIGEGWTPLLSSLKTMLETGEPPAWGLYRVVINLLDSPVFRGWVR